LSAWLIVEEPAVLEEFMGEPLLPGCMAGEPDVVEPEPVAAGRSVAPEVGAVVEVWAKAGAAKMVAKRQAAICFLSIAESPK